jgi:hypothetical protein
MLKKCDKTKMKASPAITSALSVRRLSSPLGQKPPRAAVKGVVGGQRQSLASFLQGEKHHDSANSNSVTQ